MCKRCPTTKPKNQCIDCDKTIQRHNIRCKSCGSKNRRTKKPKKELYNTIRKRGCCKCSERTDYCIEFHHLKDKVDMVSHMWTKSKYSLDDFIEEIEKCVLLCGNCHRKVHNGLLHVDERDLCKV